MAVRKRHDQAAPAERFYPAELSFPITAFLRLPAIEAHGKAPTSGEHHAMLELYDPLVSTTTEVCGARVPLESDLSTPLAHFLNNGQLGQLATFGLLRPDQSESQRGLYLTAPYDPRKVPVVFIHGLWSSPVTWMEMFNDLRSDPVVRDHYQFWFYLYPTGQPFWLSGTQMREDLALMRRKLDPERRHPALDQTVLIGHSMGGLVSKMQTVDSGDEFWRTTSDHPFSELQADNDVTRSLANAYFFDPSPSVRRVVTIGTPHRGSQFANGTTRWLGHKLITLPQQMLQGRQELLARNKGFFRPDSPIEITTSIDSLAPESPILPVLLAARPGPWISYHNVVGREPDLGWRRWFLDDGDGVVSLDSARLDDMPQLRSQIVVPSDHVNVHRHPRSILEVRRVLLEQLAELEQFPREPARPVAVASERRSEDLRRH